MSRHSKQLFDKQSKYAIRCLTVGVASVAIGTFLIGGNLVHGQEDDSVSADTSEVEIENKKEGPVIPMEDNEAEGLIDNLDHSASTDTEMLQPMVNLTTDNNEVREGTENDSTLEVTENHSTEEHSSESHGESNDVVESNDSTFESRMETASIRENQPLDKTSATLDDLSDDAPTDYSRPNQAIGSITSLSFENGVANIQFETGEKGQFSLYNNHVFRYYIDREGNFTNPAPSREDRPADIVLKSLENYQDVYGAQGTLINQTNRYIIETDRLWVIFDKATARMSVFDRIEKKFILKEKEAIQLSETGSTQVLHQNENEYFYGGGMQNGRFAHKGQSINIVNENNWVDGGVASPSPFYWSTNGYGVMRNTFARGKYDFGLESNDTVKTTHVENRFDAFYFFGSTVDHILKDYYELTGAPVVLPEFALYLGHLNAYNRDYWVEVAEGTPNATLIDGKWYREYQPNHLREGDRPKAVRETLNGINEHGEKDESYPFSARAVIDRYQNLDLPLSWFLPNDGYGAGYGQGKTLEENIANLKAFVDYAATKGIKVGLWTQSDLFDEDKGKNVVLHRNIIKEVQDAGIRVIKTDVAWVGPGYSFGLNGVDKATEFLEKYSSEHARPFIVSLDGWAGTHRSAAIWSGDQTGGEWEYIRFHIPTYIGLSLSGNPNMGSDMDGIFGGANPVINARDYQWKTFTSIMMNMDGWGAKPKNPFAFNDRITDINRMSLKVKSTLLPYAYSLGHLAAKEGRPIIRAMFVEFPDDKANYTKETQYQYMYGPSLLIAPIYKDTAMKDNGDDVRHNIFLPDSNTEWIDWYTGKKYKGGQVLNFFDAPLWKAPVFVRNGAIIPRNQANNNIKEIDRSKRLLTFYPHGNTTFTLFEDDGISTAYKNGKVATTLIESNAQDSNEKGRVVLKIHETQGEFEGFVKEKETELYVNVSEDVENVSVKVNNKMITLTKANSLEEYLLGTNVYFYDELPLMNVYNANSEEIRNLNIHTNSLLKVKIANYDVTQSEIVITIDGFIHKNPSSKIDENLSLPEKPTNISVPDESVSSTAFLVQWNNVNDASSYDIEKNGVLYTGITQNHFIFEDLAFGSSHQLRVRAVNAVGTSDWSDILDIRTTDDPWRDAIEGISATSDIQAHGGQGLDNLFDKSLGKQFHSKWSEAVRFPATIDMDLGGLYEVDKIEYHPRTDGGKNGMITQLYFSVSEDGKNWTQDKYYTNWAVDTKVKTYKFKVAKARYIRMNIADGVGHFVSGEELLVFKKTGTKMLIPGDINNDGKINEDDKTSYFNYSGLRSTDNDFPYIAHVDMNKNGLIDAQDIHVIATQLEGGVTSIAERKPSGQLFYVTDKKDLKVGETATVQLMAKDLVAVNGLTSSFCVDSDKFEVVGDIQANADFIKQTENFSRVRNRNQKTDVVFTFVNFGEKPALVDTGVVALITLRALKDCKLDFTSADSVLVANNQKALHIESLPLRKEKYVTEVPNRISDVAVTRVTSGSISLSWTPNDSALEYIVEKASGDQYEAIRTVYDSSVNVYNLAPQTDYQFRIIARNQLGDSEPSKIISIYTSEKEQNKKLSVVSYETDVVEQPGEGIEHFFDENEETLYHSDWNNTNAVPSELVVDLGELKKVDYVRYTPRSNVGNGTIVKMQVLASEDKEYWYGLNEVVVWSRNQLDKIALLPENTLGRYVKLKWIDSVGGFVSGNELAIIGESITKKIVSETKELDFTVETIEDGHLELGKVEIQTMGQNGEATEVYEEIYAGDALISRTLKTKKVSRKPINQIQRIGIKQVLSEEKVIHDNETNVQVTLARGENAQISAIRIEHREPSLGEMPEVLHDKDYDLFDIELLNDHNERLVNDKEVLVRMPVDEGKTVEMVVYLPNDASLESLDYKEFVTVVNGHKTSYIEFLAKHFSEYGIVYRSENGVAVAEMGTQTDSEDKPTTTETSTQTDAEIKPLTTEDGTQNDSEVKPTTTEDGTQTDSEDKPTTTEDGTQTDSEVKPTTTETSTQTDSEVEEALQTKLKGNSVRRNEIDGSQDKNGELPLLSRKQKREANLPKSGMSSWKFLSYIGFILVGLSLVFSKRKAKNTDK